MENVTVVWIVLPVCHDCFPLRQFLQFRNIRSIMSDRVLERLYGILPRNLVMYRKKRDSANFHDTPKLAQPRRFSFIDMRKN